jgi:hypothetical protein
MIVTTFTILTLLGGAKSPTACLDKCSETLGKCMERCGSNNKCSEDCNRRSMPCNNACTAEDDKKFSAQQEKNSKMPCGVDSDRKTATPCSDKETKAMQQTVKDAKGWCKSPEGEPIPCAGEEDKARAAMKKQGIEIGCKDSSGMPIECPTKK